MNYSFFSFGFKMFCSIFKGNFLVIRCTIKWTKVHSQFKMSILWNVNDTSCMMLCKNMIRLQTTNIIQSMTHKKNHKIVKWEILYSFLRRNKKFPYFISSTCYQGLVAVLFAGVNFDSNSDWPDFPTGNGFISNTVKSKAVETSKRQREREKGSFSCNSQEALIQPAVELSNSPGIPCFFSFTASTHIYIHYVACYHVQCR